MATNEPPTPKVPTSDQHRANVLFGDAGGTSPTPAPPGSNQRHADTLFGGAAAPVVPSADPNAPPAPAVSVTASPMEQAIFGLPTLENDELFQTTKAMTQTFWNRREELTDVLALTQDQQHARHNEFASTIRESGLDPVTVGGLIYNSLTDAEIAEARGTDLDDAALNAANENVRQRLREQYGASDGEDLLMRTHAFVKAHPKLRAVIDRRGVGSNPEIALALVEHVRRNHIK